MESIAAETKDVLKTYHRHEPGAAILEIHQILCGRHIIARVRPELFKSNVLTRVSYQ